MYAKMIVNVWQKCETAIKGNLAKQPNPTSTSILQRPGHAGGDTVPASHIVTRKYLFQYRGPSGHENAIRGRNVIRAKIQLRQI